MYTNPKIMLLGLNGDLPTLKRLAAAGRLLVVDFGQIAHDQDRDAIVSWLQANAYGIVRDYRERGEDLYFISPPADVSEGHKTFSVEAFQALVPGARVVRPFTYPFNRRE
jgi:hypothetical protein